MSLCRLLLRSRALHSSARRHAVSEFQMPAMSPTMTEGGIAAWKKKEGEAFSAGDVLLEIETDKATMDVEAQDDGVLGKIIIADGSKNVPVGKVIALMAEEGDDISHLEAPRDTSSPPPPPQPEDNEKPRTVSAASSPLTPKPTPSPPQPQAHGSSTIHHSLPLFPSVQRLLLENNISDADRIKGTGKRGMLTKGDVLAHIGKIKSPFGTWIEEAKAPDTKAKEAGKQAEKGAVNEVDGPILRMLMAAGLANLGKASPLPPAGVPSFDTVLDDYLPKPVASITLPVLPLPDTVVTPVRSEGPSSFLDGLY